MSDIVTCKCVLKKSADPTRVDSLFLEANGVRILPCRPKGEPRRDHGHPEWEYEERGGRLHLQPSMLCTETQFHTAYHWDVDYEVCPDGVGQYERFYEVNPSLGTP